MKPIGIAVWGLGNHAVKRILPAIYSNTHLELIGICSRSEEKVKKAISSWNCEGWTSTEKMLGSKKVDVVYIATPIGLHYDFSLMALKAKKHVWCEKPLTNGLKETKHLISTAKKQNRAIYEAFMYIHHPQFLKLKEMIESQNFGKLQAITCKFGVPGLIEPGFRYDESLGGGAFWDLGSYPISICLALLNYESQEVIFSELLRSEKNNIDIEGRALLNSSRGVRSYVEWSLEAGYKNEIDLWFEEGSIFADKIFSKPENFDAAIIQRDKNGNKNVINIERSEQFCAMFDEFATRIRNGNVSQNEYKFILKRAALMEKIKNKSIESHR